MKQGKIGEIKIVLDDKDWNQLVRRFDPDRIKWTKSHYKGVYGGRIWVKCICFRYSDCRGCPLAIAPEKPAPCLELARKILDQSEYKGLVLSDRSVYILDEHGFTGIIKIREALLSMAELES